MKKIISTVLIVSMMIGCIGCSSQKTNDKKGDDTNNLSSQDAENANLKQPPELTFITNRGKEEAELINYKWTFKDDSGKSVTEEKTIKEEKDAFLGYTANSVHSGDNVKLDFQFKPTKTTVKVISPTPSTPELTNLEFSLPIEKGLTFIKISAEWDQGNAEYIVSLQVDE